MVQDPVGFADAVGRALDACVNLMLVDAERELLVSRAASLREPELAPLVNEAMRSTYRLGEPIPGRVWEAETGLWIPELDYRVLAQTLKSTSARLITQLKVHSLLSVPLWEQGRVVGVIGAFRRLGRPAFSEAEYLRLERWGREYGSGIPLGRIALEGVEEKQAAQ